MAAMIGIIVNGERRETLAGARVADLLNALELPVTKVAVELNRAIVPRSRFEAQPLADGDKIEIVHFVGGG
jgi:thiamine biosynthesis protein ThiS